MNSPKHSRAAARVEKFQRWRQQSATTTAAVGETTKPPEASKAAWRSKKLPIPQRDEEEETSNAVQQEEPQSVSARRQAFDRGASSSKETTKSWKRSDKGPTSSSSGKKFALADRWNQVASPTNSPPFWKTHQQTVSQKASSPESTRAEERSPQAISPKSTEDEAPAEPPRLRVSDVRSMFQQKAASRPVRSFQSPKEQHPTTFQPSSKEPSFQERSLSPIPKVSSPGEESTTNETPDLTIVTTEPDAPKQWDSPRRARLRALAAAAEATPEPISDVFQRNIDSKKDSFRATDSRMKDSFRTMDSKDSVKTDSFRTTDSVKKDSFRTMDSTMKDSVKRDSVKRDSVPVKKDSFRAERVNGTTMFGLNSSNSRNEKNVFVNNSRIDKSTTVQNARQIEEDPVVPPEEEEEEAHEAIETPQKLSVSAMKAKLWGDAEKLKVPIRKAPSSAKKNFEPPTSPISDTRRKFDNRGGIVSPQSPVLSSPPQTFAPYYGSQYVSQKTQPRHEEEYYGSHYVSQKTPPRHEEEEEEEEGDQYNDPTLSPMQDSEDEILYEEENYDKTETELGSLQEDAKEVPARSVASQPFREPPRPAAAPPPFQEPPRSLASPPFQEPPPSNAWMNRTFKRNIGSALESKIQSLWGGNQEEEPNTRDMQLPDLQDQNTRAHPPRPSSRPPPVRNGVSPPLNRPPREASVTPPPINGEGQKSHVRSTSIGDFQVELDRNAMSMNSSEPLEESRGRCTEKGQAFDDDFRALSPPSRPAYLQTRDRSDEPLSPIYQDSQFRGSSSSRITYDMAESGFSEAIDQPPYEDASEASDAPMSPRGQRQDYPWNKDADTLSPSMWQKRKEPDFDDDDVQPMSMPSRNNKGLELEVDVDDQQEESNQHSPSSLNQLAKDSFYAVDHDQAAEAFERLGDSDDERSSMDDFIRTETLPNNVPPEFERVVQGRDAKGEFRPVSSPIFGRPESFVAAGDEQVPVEPVSVAERAQAIAAWNGGLGVSPTPVDKQEIYRREISQRLSPILSPKSSFTNVETAFKGMSPNFERKGVAIDDWKIERVDNGEFTDQSTDVWGPVSLDSFAEYDWVNGAHSGERAATDERRKNQETSNEQLMLPPEKRDIPEPQSEPSMDAFSSSGPIDADDVYFSMTASVKQPQPTYTLEKSKTDITSKQPKKLKDWRKSHGKSGKRGRKSLASTSTVVQRNTEFVFDPFNDPFETKVDSTETTEPTDGTDLFGSPDPFFPDQNSFAPDVMKPIARRTRNLDRKPKIFQADEPLSYASDRLAKDHDRRIRKFQPDEPLSYASDQDGQPNLFVELAPPSGTFDDSKEEIKDGSKDDVWSCDIGLSSEGLSYEIDNGNHAVYDADTSNLNESSAVEI